MVASLQVLIFGDGPAARLAAIALHGLGARVVRALPRPGLGPPPTARHTHYIDNVTYMAAAIDDALAGEIQARIEPGWLWRRNTGTGWHEYTGPRISRAIVDAALEARLAGLPMEIWRDVRLIGRDGDDLIAACSDGRGTFDLTIDATGAHRATLPMIAPCAQGFSLEDDGPSMRYQTLELTFRQTEAQVCWSSPALNGAKGALYGELDGTIMRITASQSAGTEGIGSLEDIARVFDPIILDQVPGGARLVDRISTVAPQYRRLRAPDADLPNWIALGDAGAQWPPRLGTGVGAIFRQCRLLKQTLAEGANPAEARAALDLLIDGMWDNRANDLALRQP